MNCQSIQPLLSEFADEALDAAMTWQVQTHLSGCAACSRISRDMESLKRALKTLPAQSPSAGFDAALAQRLALTRRPAAPPQTWRTRFSGFFSARLASPAQRLRPALALGLVLAAGALAVLVPSQHSAPIPKAVTHSADPTFVADCVAQHHRDAASEPLADLSAQTLAGSLDGSASLAQSAATGSFTEPSDDASSSADSSLL